MKKCMFVLILLTLSSCSLLPERPITTRVVKVNVPVIYSEAPPVIPRPDLAIHELPVDARGNYAQIARHYKISVLQLLNYVEQLELVLDNYKIINETLDKTGIIIDDGIDVEVD